MAQMPFHKSHIIYTNKIDPSGIFNTNRLSQVASIVRLCEGDANKFFMLFIGISGPVRKKFGLIYCYNA